MADTGDPSGGRSQPHPTRKQRGQPSPGSGPGRGRTGTPTAQQQDPKPGLGRAAPLRPLAEPTCTLGSSQGFGGLPSRQARGAPGDTWPSLQPAVLLSRGLGWAGRWVTRLAGPCFRAPGRRAGAGCAAGNSPPFLFPRAQPGRTTPGLRPRQLPSSQPPPVHPSTPGLLPQGGCEARPPRAPARPWCRGRWRPPQRQPLGRCAGRRPPGFGGPRAPAAQRQGPQPEAGQGWAPRQPQADLRSAPPRAAGASSPWTSGLDPVGWPGRPRHRLVTLQGWELTLYGRVLALFLGQPRPARDPEDDRILLSSHPSRPRTPQGPGHHGPNDHTGARLSLSHLSGLAVP